MQIQCQEVTTPEQKEACLALRRLVFVEEQGVPSTLEVDGQDDRARHFAATLEGRMIATCRVRRMSATAKIERVAVLREYRRQGVGQALMKYVLQELMRGGDIDLLKLSSQADAVPFYERLNFKRRGPEYMDAGMPHYDMIKEVTKA